jgi:hypothetical protein
LTAVAELQNLCREMYEGYGGSKESGRRYFGLYLSQIMSVGQMELLIFLLKSDYPLRYVLDVLLSLPEIWRDFSSSEWIRLMSSVTPRSNSISWKDEEAGYADFVFLCRYLNVNALSVYCDLDGVPREDKCFVLTHFEKNPYPMLLDDLDKEDLDGEYFVDNVVLTSVKRRLLKEGIFEEFTYTGDQELREYLSKLQAGLGN